MRTRKLVDAGDAPVPEQIRPNRLASVPGRLVQVEKGDRALGEAVDPMLVLADRHQPERLRLGGDKSARRERRSCEQGNDDERDHPGEAAAREEKKNNEPGRSEYDRELQMRAEGCSEPVQRDERERVR